MYEPAVVLELVALVEEVRAVVVLGIGAVLALHDEIGVLVGLALGRLDVVALGLDVTRCRHHRAVVVVAVPARQRGRVLERRRALRDSRLAPLRRDLVGQGDARRLGVRRAGVGDRRSIRERRGTEHRDCAQRRRDPRHPSLVCEHERQPPALGRARAADGAPRSVDVTVGLRLEMPRLDLEKIWSGTGKPPTAGTLARWRRLRSTASSARSRARTTRPLHGSSRPGRADRSSPCARRRWRSCRRSSPDHRPCSSSAASPTRACALPAAPSSPWPRPCPTARTRPCTGPTSSSQPTPARQLRSSCWAPASPTTARTRSRAG